MPEPILLELIDFYWRILLIASSFVLNIAALVLTLRKAGTCAKDSTVPPLFSILGSNILHILLVQILQIHERATTTFAFGEDVCRLMQVNATIFTCVPFPTLCLQLLVLLRWVGKGKSSRSCLSLCSSQVCIILLPWLLGALLSGLHAERYTITKGLCVSLPPPLWLQVMTVVATLGLPVLLVLLGLVSACPTLCRRRAIHSTRDTVVNKRDLVLFGVLVMAHTLCQAPVAVAKGLSLYGDEGLSSMKSLQLLLHIGGDLPHLLNPMGVLLLRVCREERVDKVRTPSEENMIIKLEAKDLENALFESKTTIL